MSNSLIDCEYWGKMLRNPVGNFGYAVLVCMCVCDFPCEFMEMSRVCGMCSPRGYQKLDVRLLGNFPHCFKQTSWNWQQLSESLAPKNNRTEKHKEQRSATINGNK